jgi:hypothetical protein
MYKDIMNGGELEYTMGKKPNYSFGQLKPDWAISNPQTN